MAQYGFQTEGRCAAYELRSSDEWADDLSLTTLQPEVGNDRISLWRDCPRCKHQLSDVIFKENANTSNYKIQTVIACNCQSKHDGRLEGATGCGAYAGLTVERKNGQITLDKWSATAEDKRWDELAYKAVTGAAAGAKALAEKWSATVATLLSIIGIAAILGLFEQLVELPSEWRWATALLLIFAVFSAAYATWFAADAAQGKLTWEDEVTGPRLREREKTTLSNIASQLKESREWTARAIAITALIVAIAILVEGAEEENGPKLLVVSDQLAKPPCGSLAPGRAGQLTLQPEGEEAEPVAISVDEIATVTTVDDCPE